MPKEYFPDRDVETEPDRPEIARQPLDRLADLNARLVSVVNVLRDLNDDLHGVPAPVNSVTGSGGLSAAAPAPGGRMQLIEQEIDNAFGFVGRLETQLSRLRYGNF